MKKFKWVVMNVLGLPLALIVVILEILITLAMYVFKALYGVFGFKDNFDYAMDFNAEQFDDFFDNIKFK